MQEREWREWTGGRRSTESGRKWRSRKKEYRDERAGGWKEDGEEVREGVGGKELSGEDDGRRRKIQEMFGENEGVVERKVCRNGRAERGQEGEEYGGKRKKEHGGEETGRWRENGKKFREGAGEKEWAREMGEGRGRRRKVWERLRKEKGG